MATLRAEPPPSASPSRVERGCALEGRLHPLRRGDPAGPEKPLRFGCYGKWKKYGNAEYAEKHCHACGKEVQTSVVTPLCKPCYVEAHR